MSYQELIGRVLTGVLTQTMALEKENINALADWVETPKDRKKGDFAFPCFRLAKLLRKNPAQISASLLDSVAETLAGLEEIDGVTAEGPYLNFSVNKSYMAKKTIPAILDGSFLQPRDSKNQRVMIEYSQPNTHKAFHVGHTRNVALGDALVRMFNWNGYDVVAANYIGDEGTHIAKCLWYLQTHYQGPIPDSNRGEFLGDLYTRATEMLDFKTLTRCPIPGVVIGQVESVEPVSEKPERQLVQVFDGQQRHQVICGGTGFQMGDRVGYAAVGSRIGGRQIGVVEKYGVQSAGMICSGKELGLNDERQAIYTFPDDAPLGQALAEYFRLEGSLDPSVPVLEEMDRRTSQVGEILKKLETRDPEIEALWQKTKQWSMDEFHEIYQWLDAPFDHFFFESQVGDEGKAKVLEYYEKGVFVASEGAIGADLSDAKLPFFLLLKSDGSGLYSTKDIALAKRKFDEFGIDRSIYVVDASQSLHFQQVFKTLEKMGYQRAQNCYHLAYGLVVLPDGKMSSRQGNIILFSQLRQRLDEKIRREFLDKYRDQWSEEEIAEASKRIAVATIKYGMTNQDNLKVIVFDLDDWTARTGNTGPYLMYAYARTRSVLREVGPIQEGDADWSLLTHELEQQLLATMAKFPETVARACSEYRPQWLCIYLFQLAKDFSRMYDNCSVLRAETPALKATRAQLVDAAGRLIQKGLALLGIQTLDRM